MNNNNLQEEFYQRFCESTFVDLKPYDNNKRDDDMFEWFNSKLNGQKERLIKEVTDLDVSTMTYGAFRRKVLEILK